MSDVLPARIASVAELEDLLSRPGPSVVQTLAKLDGDVLVLGAAGKMGPTLCRMARRASDEAGTRRRVIAVSRFSNPKEIDTLTACGVEPVKADLLDPKQLAKLPDAPNVVYMAGMKFGATGNEPLTWAMNVHLPAMVCQRYAGSRIAAFSTGNIYGLSPVVLGGSVETDPLRPVGDYAMSCLGRERMFQHFSQANGTPVAIVRLNYATEMRYGVMVDMAQKVYRGEPVPLDMGALNAIWQGDANGQALQCLAKAASPAVIVNLAGPEMLSVRRLCEQFGRLMNKPVTFTGAESPDALLSNGQLSHDWFGYPSVPAQRMVEWIADWVSRGGQNIGKPTHFETRDGNY